MTKAPEFVTVDVDFNILARGGKVIALQTWADGPLVLGDKVRAYDHDGDLDMEATVSEFDPETNFFYLEF
jgi:hypothetical protein